jgi:hypothetical protein
MSVLASQKKWEELLDKILMPNLCIFLSPSSHRAGHGRIECKRSETVTDGGRM